MTTTQRPHPGRAWAATALRRAIGALQSANDELLRANEAIFRPVRAPRAGGSGAATRTTPTAPARSGGGGAGRAA